MAKYEYAVTTCVCGHPPTTHSMATGERSHCLCTGCLCPQYAALSPVTDSTKATNPKDAVGSDKLPLYLWPPSATAYGCIGMLNGMLKYGRTNWREAGIRPSIYADAAARHIIDWFEGEESDPDDGVHNLSAALACLAILVDAIETGTLNDDRAYKGSGWRNARAKMEPHVKRLKELHAGRDPKHWTIKDNPNA